MEFTLCDLVMASLLMGLGIGSDVAIATFIRANKLTRLRTACLWIIGVSFTHTIFPMLGYLLTYFSLQLHPNIEPIVGIIAFSFILFYLVGEFNHFVNPEQATDNSQLLITIGIILAVSWDALWSGPAKSAQVIGWPELFVWVSFVIVGMFVSVMAIFSLNFALRFKHRIKNTHNTRLFIYWLQYSVIGYFGLLALFNYTLGLNLDWWQTLTVSGVITALSMGLIVKKSAVVTRKTIVM